MGWEGAALPSILVGVVASCGFAWYLVKSERALATRPPTQARVGLIVGAAVIGTLLIRLGPPALIYVLIVAGVAMFLGGVISSVYELVRGTYAEAGRQHNQR